MVHAEYVHIKYLRCGHRIHCHIKVLWKERGHALDAVVTSGECSGTHARHSMALM